MGLFVFLAFHQVLTLLSRRDFIFPRGEACVGTPQMTSQRSLSHFARGIKILTAAYAVAGS